jgi:hypothetical protein
LVSYREKAAAASLKLSRGLGVHASLRRSVVVVVARNF